MGPLPLALGVVAAVFLPLNAQAQQLWGEVGLPGGAVAARQVAGLGPSTGRTDASWLLDVIRSDNGGDSVTRQGGILSRYLTAVDVLQTELGRWPDGIVLPKERVTVAEEARLQTVFDALGLALRRRDNQYFAELDDAQRAVERREWLETISVDFEKVIADLNFGLPAKISIGESVVPLPLPRVWSTTVFKSGTLPVLSILQDASARSLYLGLMAMDLETLGFLAERPVLVQRLGNALGVFAAYGRSLRVHGGVVQLPGGSDVAAWWESMVGRSPDEPERFIPDLLAQDEGRLAYFYDAVAHLTASRQAFVLGAHLPMDRRIAFVRRIYRLFRDVDTGWKIGKQPFHRPDVDPAMPLTWVDVLSDGTVGPSWWPPLLSRVFASDAWPTKPSPAPSGLSTTREADAAWLMEWLFDSAPLARRKFEALRYMQRNFHDVGADGAPSIEIAIRARLDMPALALALERMNVRDPLRLANVARAARTLTYAGGVDAAGPVVARWQVCLGLLEQIHLRAHLAPARLNDLLESLVQPIPKSPDLGGVWFATWVSDHLLPAILDGAVGPDLERQALLAFAGVGRAPARRVAWEGLDYAFDRSTSTFQSAWRIRQTRPGPRLQHLVQLLGLVRRLQAGLQTLDDVKSVADAATALAPALRLLPKTAEAIDPAWRPVTDVAKALGRITKAGDVKRASAQAVVLARALGAVEDAVLPAILYALAVSPTSATDVFSDASSGHDLTGMFALADTRPWQVKAWQVPSEQSLRGGGTSLMGAFLLLDVALADATLVRLPSAELPTSRLFDDRAAAALDQHVAILNADAMESSPVSPGLHAGRQRIAAWIARASAATEVEPILRQAGVDEWRTNLVLAALEEQRARAFDVLTVAEVYQIGSGASVPAAWSGPAMAIDGCVCQVSSEMRRLEDLRGERHGVRTALLTDVPLRLAEHMDAMKLPAWLVPPMLVMATQDWIEHIYQFDVDDWESFTIWPKDIPRDRVEESCCI